MMTANSPTCARILAALRLRPNDAASLRLMLGMPVWTLYNGLSLLHEAGKIERRPRVIRTRGARSALWFVVGHDYDGIQPGRLAA